MYTWGRGDDGNLGHNDEKDCVTPVMVRDLKGAGSLKIGAGNNFMFACTGKTKQNKQTNKQTKHNEQTNEKEKKSIHSVFVCLSVTCFCLVCLSVCLSVCLRVCVSVT